MAKIYLTVSETDRAVFDEKLADIHKTHSTFKVEGFAFDGTNYVALVSFDT